MSSTVVVVTQAGSRDVDGNPAREQMRGMGVTQDVQRSGGNPGRFPLLTKPLGQPLRVDGQGVGETVSVLDHPLSRWYQM